MQNNKSKIVSVNSYLQNKGMTLFSSDQMFGRQVASRSDAVNRIKPHAVNLVNAVMNGYNAYYHELENRHPCEINRNWKANELNCKVQGQLSRMFKDSFLLTKDNNYILNIGGFTIHYKLCDSNLRPKYNDSANTIMHKNQLSNNPNDKPLIYILYEMDKSRTNLEGIYLKYKNGNIDTWVIDLIALANNQSSTSLKNQQITRDINIKETLVAVKPEATGKLITVKKTT